MAPMGHRGSARDLKEALLADTPSTPTTGSFVLKILAVGGLLLKIVLLYLHFRRGGEEGILPSEWPKSCRN